MAGYSMTTIPLDLVITTPDHETPGSVASQARRAESRGFARVSMGETTGWNVVPVLAVVAERTDEIGISDDVISPFSRSPALLGQTALTLQEISHGRFRLGLGASSPALAEHWHGRQFDRPIRRLRETVEIVREVYRGDEVEYDGDIYEIDGLRYEREPAIPVPPIDVAALGPTAVEMTGRFADGWVPQLFTPDGLSTRLDDFERGADLGSRDRDTLRVAPLIRCFAHEDRERAREATRRTVAFLIGAYGPFYGDSVADQGYVDVVADIRDAWKDDRDTAAMAAALPEEVLDELAAAGTPQEVRASLLEFAQIEGVSAIRVGFVGGMDQDEKERTMDALAELT